MRLSHCESHCSGPFRYVPCLPKSNDASGGAASVAAAAAARPAAGVVAATEEEPPPVQKIEVEVELAREDEDEEENRKDDVKAAAATTAAAPTKSSLKKASCSDGAAKGNVQWLDWLGKDLTEVREFEPRDNAVDINPPANSTNYRDSSAHVISHLEILLLLDPSWLVNLTMCLL